MEARLSPLLLSLAPGGPGGLGGGCARLGWAAASRTTATSATTGAAMPGNASLACLGCTVMAACSMPSRLRGHWLETGRPTPIRDLAAALQEGGYAGLCPSQQYVSERTPGPAHSYTRGGLAHCQVISVFQDSRNHRLTAAAARGSARARPGECRANVPLRCCRSADGYDKCPGYRLVGRIATADTSGLDPGVGNWIQHIVLCSVEQRQKCPSNVGEGSPYSSASKESLSLSAFRTTLEVLVHGVVWIEDNNKEIRFRKKSMEDLI